VPQCGMSEVPDPLSIANITKADLAFDALEGDSDVESRSSGSSRSRSSRSSSRSSQSSDGSNVSYVDSLGEFDTPDRPSNQVSASATLTLAKEPDSDETTTAAVASSLGAYKDEFIKKNGELCAIAPHGRTSCGSPQGLRAAGEQVAQGKLAAGARRDGIFSVTP